MGAFETFPTLPIEPLQLPMASSHRSSPFCPLLPPLCDLLDLSHTFYLPPSGIILPFIVHPSDYFQSSQQLPTNPPRPAIFICVYRLLLFTRPAAFFEHLLYPRHHASSVKCSQFSLNLLHCRSHLETTLSSCS